MTWQRGTATSWQLPAFDSLQVPLQTVLALAWPFGLVLV